MTETELAWLAGWMEGEGTFYGAYVKTRKDYWYHRVTLRAVSTDKDTIEKAHRITGVGRIYGPYMYGTNKQENWQWAVCKRVDAETLMHILRPHMSSRRQVQIDEALRKGNPE